MPVLLAGREPDHITGPDLLDRSAFALSPAAARRDDEGLTERMRVPGAADKRELVWDTRSHTSKKRSRGTRGYLGYPPNEFLVVSPLPCIKSAGRAKYCRRACQAGASSTCFLMRRK